MSEEQSPVEVVAEEASAQSDSSVDAVAEALKAVATAANGKSPTPNDFKQVLRSIRTATDDLLEEETPKGIDPDRFFKLARKLAADNYNDSKNGRRNLKPENVHIDWYNKVMSNWKAGVSSPIVRDIMWVITYNGYKKEAYVGVFRNTANIKVEGVEPK